MAEAIVSTILEQLASILVDQTAAKVSLIAGAEEQVENLGRSFHLIKAVVEDAEKRQLKESAVKDWLDDLKHTSYDIEDVLDEWNTAIRKLQMRRSSGVANASQPMRTVCLSFIIPSYWFSPRQLVLRHNIATRIKNLDKKLENIVKDISTYGFIISREQGSGVVAIRPSTTSFLDESNEVRGRKHLQIKVKVANLLMGRSESSTASAASSSQVPTQHPTIISITGMGGIGKTTLAKLIFNDNEVSNNFDEKIWVCVSEPFNDIRIAKAILESLKGSATNAVESETVLKQLRESIEGKKFFLVLDDVWTEQPQDWDQLWGCLRRGSNGSRILVTTRKEKAAIVMGTTNSNIIPVELLSDEDSWSIFSQVSLSRMSDIEEYEKFKNIGRQIVGKCKGLPLAVKTLGSLLRFKGKIEEWQRVLESELWELEEIEKGLLGPLLLSYYDLPSPWKKCFLYCAIFPKDSRLEKDKLIRLWMAHDYLKVKGGEDMKVVGEEYFDNLAMRSLFQDFKRSEHDGGKIISCKMHDIVHDFSQFLTKTECSVLDVNTSRLELPCWKARHLMITGENSFEKVLFPSFVYDETKLRSLALDVRLESEPTLSKLFDRLTCLRSIDGLPVGQIPKGIKKLIHLRYLALGLSERVKELPEALCELCNLQTLDVRLCLYLKRLPERIGELINLRHLTNTGKLSRLSYMPRGMERLTGLRTLGSFAASAGKSSKACSSLKSLNKLKHLEGSLTLTRLGNERDLGDDNDDEKVDLKSKMKLVELNLRFASPKKTKDHRVVLECLQPPQSLEKLEIYGYEGDTIPPTSNWMLSLTKLRVLLIEDCSMCDCLPCLGKLPCLETLVLGGMSSVKRLGNEFLGIAEDDQARVDQAETASSIIRDTPFPRLELLIFSDMEKWEEWDDCEITGGKTIMPRLRSLWIGGSPELKALPDYILGSTSLDRLEIYDSRHLNNRYNNETGPDWPKISHVAYITFTLGGPAAQGSL